MELRTYKYRLYPSRKQEKRLFQTFKHCKFVYNELLELNQKLWITNRPAFNSLIKDIKVCHPEISNDVHSQVLQNAGDRLSKAFNNFFARLELRKKGIKVKAGFPRFKSRIASITYPQSGFKFGSNKRLLVSKIGNMPIVLHRVPRGKIKTLTIKQNCANQWFAVFSCELNTPIVQHAYPDKSVGVDAGIIDLVALSNGELVNNPRHFVKAEKRLKLLQRKLSRKSRGSKNRAKARLRLAKQHVNVVNRRRDFLHKLSHRLTTRYASIGVEDLNIKNMVRNHCLAKHISDAGWGTFAQMLSYKAVTSGGQLVKVEPRGTTTECYKCGLEREMPLRERQFVCARCGWTCHRDVNSALNVQGRAGLARTFLTPVDIKPLHSLFSGNASLVNEAGTIYGKKLRSSIPLEAHRL